MNCEHTPSRPDERFRVEENNGIIIKNKVNAVLGVTRSFGDRDQKDYIIARPECVTVPIN